METALTGLLVVLLVVLLFSKQQPSAPPPMVIYVERPPAPASGDQGCLPALILLGLLAAMLLIFSA